jgi:ABC-type transport system involved in Fe-S cluster assembly fused permease/ATPase subunit
MNIVNNVLKDKTLIFAAHRLSTITNCDNIIVIGENGVLEQGTHKELLRIPHSKYSILWKQFLHHDD